MGNFLLLVVLSIIAILAAGIIIGLIAMKRSGGEDCSYATCAMEGLNTVARQWGKAMGLLSLKWEHYQGNKKIRAQREEVKLNRKDFEAAVKKYEKISVPVPQQLIDDCRKIPAENMVELVCQLTVALQYYESCYGSDMISALVYDFPENYMNKKINDAATKVKKGIKNSKARNGKKK